MHIWRLWYNYRDDGTIIWQRGVVEVIAATGIEAFDTLKSHFSAGCTVTQYIQLADQPRILW